MAPDDTRSRSPRASATTYRQLQATLGLQRVAFVQSNFHGNDNRGMLDAMAGFGAEARGVVVVTPNVDDAELQRLSALGVCGVRFHMLPGGTLQCAHLDAVVARVQPFGWHVQLLFDGWELPQHVQRLHRLPLDIVIDHLGKYLGAGPPAVADPAFRALQRVLDGGRAGSGCRRPTCRRAAVHWNMPTWRCWPARWLRRMPSAVSGSATGRTSAARRRRQTPKCSTGCCAGPTTGPRAGASWSTTRWRCTASRPAHACRSERPAGDAQAPAGNVAVTKHQAQCCSTSALTNRVAASINGPPCRRAEVAIHSVAVRRGRLIARTCSASALPLD